MFNRRCLLITGVGFLRILLRIKTSVCTKFIQNKSRKYEVYRKTMLLVPGVVLFRSSYIYVEIKSNIN